MARALSEESKLYRAVIKTTRGSYIDYCYYGPYSTPAPGKSMVSQLRRVGIYDDVELVRIEVSGPWEVYEG